MDGYDDHRKHLPFDSIISNMYLRAISIDPMVDPIERGISAHFIYTIGV